MAKHQIKLLLLAAAALSLCACTSVKKELGIGRNSPDEFLVVKRAPLALPPDYTLRPPANPADAAPAAEVIDTVKTSLLGKNETPAVKGSSDNALLNKIGVPMANPDIRRQIDEENGYISFKNRTVADKLIFWDDKQQTSMENIPDSVVDPKAEAGRIKQNQAGGKPITDGAVPVIEKKKGALDKIF